jgi:hypothetical protein
LVQPPKDETPEQKKKRQAEARKEARKRPFKEKESYRWTEQFWILDFGFWILDFRLRNNRRT